MAVTKYTSADGSAPTITRATGELIQLLDAVLVDGYGAKPAAGWTKSFSGTNKAVYRQGTGSTQRYLVVDDSTNADYAGPGTTVFGAWDATSISAQSRIFTRADANYMHKPDLEWVMYANAKAFYLFTKRTGDAGDQGPYDAFFFGDIVSHYASDAGRCAIVGSQFANSGAVAVDSPIATTSGVTYCRMAGDHLGYIEAVSGGQAVQGWPARPSVGVGQATLLGTARYPGYFHKSPVLLPVGLYHNTSDLAIAQSDELRGLMPGLYRAVNTNYFPKNGSSMTIGSKTLECRWVKHSSDGLMPLFIETSDTWGN